jgi:hypothetical protein
MKIFVVPWREAPIQGWDETLHFRPAKSAMWLGTGRVKKAVNWMTLDWDWRRRRGGWVLTRNENSVRQVEGDVFWGIGSSLFSNCRLFSPSQILVIRSIQLMKEERYSFIHFNNWYSTLYASINPTSLQTKKIICE